MYVFRYRASAVRPNHLLIPGLVIHSAFNIHSRVVVTLRSQIEARAVNWAKQQQSSATSINLLD